VIPLDQVADRRRRQQIREGPVLFPKLKEQFDRTAAPVADSDEDARDLLRLDSSIFSLSASRVGCSARNELSRSPGPTLGWLWTASASAPSAPIKTPRLRTPGPRTRNSAGFVAHPVTPSPPPDFPKACFDVYATSIWRRPYAYAGSLVTISQADRNGCRQFAAVNSPPSLLGCNESAAERTTRAGAGGARLERRIDGLGQSNRNDCRLLPGFASEPSEAAMATTAERFSSTMPDRNLFSRNLQMPRLPETILHLGRIACRSSLAEITGNNRTSAQPRTHRNTSGETDELLPRRLGRAKNCAAAKKIGAPAAIANTD